MLSSKTTQALSIVLGASNADVVAKIEGREKSLPNLMAQMTYDDLQYYAACLTDCKLAAENSWPGCDPNTVLRPTNARLVTEALRARGFYVKQYTDAPILHALLFRNLGHQDWGKKDGCPNEFAPTEEANKSMREWIGLRDDE